MTAASAPRRLRADAARNRQALIDAAERLFAARGLAVTLDEIAAAAGVNVATAYRHFANKHELAHAFLEQKIDQAVAIAQEAASAEDPWQGLVQFITRSLELIVANRDLHDVFTPGHKRESLDRLDQRIDPLLTRLVTRAQATGALREDLEPGDLSVILAMLGAVGDIPAENQELLLRRYVTLLLCALRPAPVPLPGGAPAQARQAHAPRSGAPGRRADGAQASDTVES